MMLRHIIQRGICTRIRTPLFVGTSFRIKQFHSTTSYWEENAKKPKITIGKRKKKEVNEGGEGTGSGRREVNVESSTNDVKKEGEDVSSKEDPPLDGESVLDVPIPIHDQLSRKVDDELVKNYVDTMHIFNQLQKLGFNAKQSDLILQLINENLTYQLDKMNGKFTTLMELENEAYLFEAAQSELRVEINTSRELDLHNLDRLKNSLDDLVREEGEDLNKFMIVSRNDTEVSVNEQTNKNTLLQKGIKMKIKDLDNKISTNINSDIKSDIESLRWQTTRSGLAAILVLVFSIIGGVSISKKINREEQPTEVILHTVQPEIESEDDEEEQGDGTRLG